MSSEPADATTLVGGRSRRRSILFGVGFTALLALTALGTYNGVTSDRFRSDLSITQWVQKLQVNETAEELVLYAAFAALGGAIAFGGGLWIWFRGHRVDVVLLGLAQIPNILNFPLRDLYGRPRPFEPLVNVIGHPSGYSYPSGHSVALVFVFGVFVFLLMQYTRNRRVTYPALMALMLYIPFGGLYFVHYGRHWPSDVLGGFLYGLVYLVIWIRLFHIGRAWERRYPEALTMATVRRVLVKLRLSTASGT
jgi:membrane-associated phospholipid phosphatase